MIDSIEITEKENAWNSSASFFDTELWEFPNYIFPQFLIQSESSSVKSLNIFHQ